MKFRYIIKYFQLPFQEKIILCEAMFWLAVFRLALLFISFKKISSYLGQQGVVIDDSVCIESRNDVEEIRRVIRAVGRMSRNLPWECKCLVQAISAKRMLKRRNVESTVYLGVTKKDGFSAHAWLRVDDTVVIGGGELSKYSVVSYFT